jgi:hypothetical protein
MSAKTPNGPTPELKAKMNAYAGTRAVHREGGIRAPVTISQIIWSEQISIKGSQLIFVTRLEPIHGIIFHCLEVEKEHLPPIFNVSAGWDYLTVKPDSWAFLGFGASWEVYLNEKACDALVKFGRESSSLDNKYLFDQAQNLLGKYGIF